MASESREGAIKRAVKTAAIALFCFALIELVFYGFAHLLIPLGLVIKPPEESAYEEYLEFRHPVLGWPRPDSAGKGEIDSLGSRIVSGFPDPATPSCVSTYGDSFTWGDEVPAEHAYPTVLANLLDCRVNNFGVVGYGTDQALLRYQNNSADNSPTVILGHFTENIVRNVNQFRGFYAPGNFGFKPRFVIDEEGRLKGIPIPNLSVEQYLDIHRRTSELLPYEYFVPDTFGAASVLDFPYSAVIARTFFHYRIRSALKGSPSYAGFYDRDHPSGGLDVTIGILSEFRRSTGLRGQAGLVLLIPDSKDLVSLAGQGTAPYDPLAASLIEEGISFIDGGREMDELLKGRDPCTVFVDCNRGSHFNSDGYALLAAIVHHHLTGAE